jgi:hypothetical protein
MITNQKNPSICIYGFRKRSHYYFLAAAVAIAIGRRNASESHELEYFGGRSNLSLLLPAQPKK